MKKALMGVTAVAVASVAFTGSATSAPNASLKDTKIVLQTDPAFHGVIESNGQCVEGRIVKVLKKKKGRDKIIGGNSTDADGFFSVPEPNVRPGIYYAKVRRYDAPGGQACGGDRSNKIVI